VDKALPPDKAPPVDKALPPDKLVPPDLPLAPDTAPGVLFSDDFSSGGNFTDDGTGTWTVSGGVYSQTSCAITGQSPDAVVPGKNWADVKVSVRIRADQDCGRAQGGLALRIQGSAGCTGNKYYFCVADFDSNFLAIGELDGSCTGSGSTKSTPNLQFGTWYSMEFSAKGSQLTCTLSDGTLSSPVTVSRTNSLFNSGTVGLNLDGLKVSYDDFVVKPNP
jgi:hypothetical protein